MNIFSDPTFSSTSTMCDDFLLVRYFQGDNGEATDICCLSNKSSFQRMITALKQLRNTDIISNVGGLEFNAKNHNRSADTKEIVSSARSIGNLPFENTWTLRLISVDLPVGTMGHFITTFGNLRDIFMSRSHVRNINRIRLAKNDLSSVIKINHHVESLRFEDSGLHHSLTFAILVRESLHPTKTLHISMATPHLSNSDNDKAALKQCVALKCTPHSRMKLQVDLCALESSIYESAQRQEPIKKEVRQIMAPYYSHLKARAAEMTANKNVPVDKTLVHHFLAEYKESPTSQYVIVRNLPTLIKPYLPPLPDNQTTEGKRKQNSCNKQLTHKQTNKKKKL